MRDIAINAFHEGVDYDSSDMIISATKARDMMNMQVISKNGNDFIVTNISGTDTEFQITSGFVPVASMEFDNILFLVLQNPTTDEIELGSYPSLITDADNTIYKYRPFNNLDNSSFKTTVFGITYGEDIDIRVQKIYDDSMNVILTSEDVKPRIVNCKFKRILEDGVEKIIESADRSSEVNSNVYTTASLDDETTLILNSNKVLDIELDEISNGGRLQHGNHVYIFRYMNEDFNTTDVVGQSSICSIFSGSTLDNVKGGFEGTEAGKQVKLALSNIDEDFSYFKVYVLYSTGDKAQVSRLYEFTTPVRITSSTMTFTHSGFEELAEVSLDTINIDYTTINGAKTATEANGYLLLGNIKELTHDYSALESAAAAVTATEKISTLTIGTSGGYVNPANIYYNMGYFGAESYAFGIVFIMKDSSLSPVFPIKGYDFHNSVDLDNGIIRFSGSHKNKLIELDKVNVKHLELDISGLSSVQNDTLGFFVVRAERREDMLAQGLLIPSVRMPAVKYIKNDNYYHRDFPDHTTAEYRFVPCIDSMMEAYQMHYVGDGETNDQFVLTADMNLKDGYMPIFVNDTSSDATTADTFSQHHWSFIPGDMIVNEPGTIPLLQRDEVYIHQISKLSFNVQGEITPIAPVNFVTGTEIGLHYKQTDSSIYTTKKISTISSINYVPYNTYASGSDFISKVNTKLWHKEGASGGNQNFVVNQAYLPYFGIEINSATTLNDSTTSSTNPIGGNSRIGSNVISEGTTSGVRYDNLGNNVNAGFLISIYPNSTGPISSPASLYSSIDELSYRQATKRWKWADTGNTIDVKGGDCYISRVSRRINKSPYTKALDPQERDNINSGTVVTYWQESKHNLHLRYPEQVDAAEENDRGFFPHATSGDFTRFREIRNLETGAYSRGHSVTTTPKGFYALSTLSPNIRNSHPGRIIASSKTAPNVFKNGYRSFSGLNFQDYDTSSGKIVRMFNHHGNVIVIFERAIGVIPIEQRVQTGIDAAGAVFVEPKGIIPPSMGYYSKTIGCQNFKSMVQTPYSIYGLDDANALIWQLSDKIEIISLQGKVNSLIQNSDVSKAILGYDPEKGEVLFTFNSKTLSYSERMGSFIGRRSFTPTFYSTKGRKLLSYTDQFYSHSGEGHLIYNNQSDAYIEFVVNKDNYLTKVFDYIDIISNDVKPASIEFFTSDGVRLVGENPEDNYEQYCKVIDDTIPGTLHKRLKYKDKRFTIQIPRVLYVATSSDDKWGSGGRLRNNYIIVRITYNTNKTLKLSSVLTTYRVSNS